LKKKLLTGGLLLAGVAVHAQNVNIYGVAGVAVEHLTNVTATGGSVTRMPNLTGLAPSRLGFRGTEDLGGGLQAFFNLEMGIALDSGSMNNGGRAFGRAANVGLGGNWGRVILGRQPNMTVQAIATHVMGPALYSIASQDPYLPNAIADNAIGYLGRSGGWTFGATYSFGRDVAVGTIPSATNCPGELAADKKACTQWTAAVRYDTADWGAAMSADKLRGGRRTRTVQHRLHRHPNHSQRLGKGRPDEVQWGHPPPGAASRRLVRVQPVLRGRQPSHRPCALA